MSGTAPHSFGSFKEFVEEVVLPRHASNPLDIRLDGQPTGGNRDVAGIFWHAGRQWKVHSDIHYDRLLVACKAIEAGVGDPFIEQSAPRGNSLDLIPELRRQIRSPRKYLYV